ncbi:hypoxanthine-guanine phosphoribosyltransferase [Cymbomonas tetramitiformis]|uniref:Hypoxanthine-guanine phosphoribosyltransferase n=1 Tax=Cymbomonas tetramitiformis TaxID=36881 RepID=A0AAE0GHQ7_9CHLO|nr:hypoxanthine-guanine phosphoribosyltransferase [Cymbomonas tetramitiformis]
MANHHMALHSGLALQTSSHSTESKLRAAQRNQIKQMKFSAGIVSEICRPAHRQRCPALSRSRSGHRIARPLQVSSAAAADGDFSEAQAIHGAARAGETIQTEGNASAFFDSLWRFSRPHTIWGTTISILSVSMLAVRTPGDFNVTLLTGMLQALEEIAVRAGSGPARGRAAALNCG